MVHRVGLPLALLLIPACTLAADEPPPIPYDAKKAETLKRRMEAWLLDVSWKEYQSVGKRSPKWDAQIEKAMKGIIERNCGTPYKQAEVMGKVRFALLEAVDVGCDDPLVLYLHSRFRPGARNGTQQEENQKDSLAAARALAASKYSDMRKANAWLNTIPVLLFDPQGDDPTKENLKLVDTCFNELLKVLVSFAKDKHPEARINLLELCDLVHRNGSKVGKRKEWFDRLDKEVLSKLPKNDPIPHAAAGRFLVQYAWDARGIGLADTVTEEGWKLFKERLQEAEKRLTRAWELDKECAPAASDMIQVCMGLGRDRDEMEKWFRRALEADPNDENAFDKKFTYLLPQWGGSAEELLEFGRQAAKTERWDTLIPVYLPGAHSVIANQSGNLLTYFRKKDGPWKEIEPIIEAVRKKHPESSLGASLYLYYAWHCDQNAAQALVYAEAQKEELQLGRFRDGKAIEGARRWAKLSVEKSGKK